jgi:hypothetical protein
VLEFNFCINEFGNAFKSDAGFQRLHEHVVNLSRRAEKEKYTKRREWSRKQKF